MKQFSIRTIAEAVFAAATLLGMWATHREYQTAVNAWDEGYDAGHYDQLHQEWARTRVGYGPSTITRNPYRGDKE